MRLDQIMPKVLTLSKCFKSPTVFATTFVFQIANIQFYYYLRTVNNISTTQFNQTNQVIHSQKLAFN